MSDIFKVQMPFRIRLAVAAAEAAIRWLADELGREAPAFLLLSANESNLVPLREGDEYGRSCRVIIRLEGGYKADFTLVSWGIQGEGLGEQWSVQRLAVAAQVLRAADPFSFDPTDWVWDERVFEEGELEQFAQNVLLGGRILNTPHPAHGTAGCEDRIPTN